MKKLFSLALAILLMASTGAFAQTATGNVLGTVTDASGAVLPGVSVAISGEAGTRTTVSGADGTYRFLNMDYGTYKVTFSLQGFGSASKSVTIVTNANATVNGALSVGGKTETVEVTGEAPLADPSKRGTGTNITTEQLRDVPNSRDPWGVMRNVPGAMIDRVNIAGNENGQQAAFAGKGSTTSDVVWNLDGLVITDMSATGASPSYFDFDAFQEINVSTGGGDLTMQTGGFGLGFVTKRGTNAFHGGGRFINTSDKFASSNVSAATLADINKGGTTNRLAGGTGYCAPDSGETSRDTADHVHQIRDFGFDLGGPIVKDKLWFYATYGKQDIKDCRLTGTQDSTLLPSYNAKINWQASSNTMVSLYYFNGSKQKFGRAVGVSGVVESDTFLWNQNNAYTDGGLPGGLSKLEIQHTFSPNFYASVKAAYYDTGFTLAARGADSQSFTLDFDGAQAIGSYETIVNRRPQKTVNADGNYFFQGMGGNNQLKFGFGYRIATTNNTSHYNGNQLAGIINGGPYAAYVLRDAVPQNQGKYSSAYLGDVFTKNRLTVNVGVRYDGQSAKNLAATNPANASFPLLLPAASVAESGNLIDYKNFSPRAGFSYALNESRKTVLRGSYANYASQLSYGNVATSSIPSGYLAYGWSDTNGDRFVQPNEVNVAGGVLYSYNIDPSNRSGTAPGRIDPNLKNQRDNEVVIGIDHELSANLAVGAAYTYRKSNDLTYTPFLSAPCSIGSSCSFIQPSQYVKGTDLTARGYTVQRYTAPQALVNAGGAGRYLTNFAGYSRKFSGGELTVKKRMSHKWAANIALSLNDWTEDYADNNRVNFSGNPTRRETAALVDGGPVSILAGGSGKASFYSAFKWQVYGDAIVQLPASFSLSTALFGRQGGIQPTNITTALGADGNTAILAVADLDSQRYQNVWDLDFRLARNSKIGRVTITPSVELFNALNSDVVLGRARNANAASLGRADEIISPRIVRIGARLSF